MKHFIVSLTLALCAAGLFALDARDFQAYENSLSAKKGLPDLKLVESASPASGEYVMFINVYDWGPAVDKVVLNVGKKVRDSKLSAAAFDVDLERIGAVRVFRRNGRLAGYRATDGRIVVVRSVECESGCGRAVVLVDRRIGGVGVAVIFVTHRPVGA